MRFEQVITYIITGLFGTGLFCIGMSQWITRKACKEKIEGTCVKKREHKPTTNKVYYCDICFSYNYEGKKYTNYSVEQFGRKKQERFQEGKSYPLYVNPQKPKNIRCTNQMFAGKDVFAIVFGGFFLLGLLGMMIQQIFLWIS